MLSESASPTTPPSNDRERRVQALITQLRPNAEQALREMAERLVDLPLEKSFGAIEYQLRYAAHDFASASHQAGLLAGKKGATKAPASSAPTAVVTPGSSATEKRPG
jgi:hypothetical protein